MNCKFKINLGIVYVYNFFYFDIIFVVMRLNIGGILFFVLLFYIIIFFMRYFDKLYVCILVKKFLI